ncbi:glycoside hydrolase family 3 N-terminal domain-containing protein, partial [Euzebya rosea]|uniref:glycoside hydrolase family 3 N-terminal domain-containing protein n=1 Tax=Euzebya rosea TaxID=2052804 RepID=UPI000D3EA55E
MSRTGGGPVGRRRLGPAGVGTARLSAVLAVLTVLALVTGLPTPGSASGSSASSGSASSGPAWSSGSSGDGTCQPLSTAQLVAQVIGAPLRSPTADATATTLAAEHAGTVVLLGDAITSAEQVRGLVDTLDASAPAGLPPLIAVDEEGGRVARFGRAGVTVRLPSARQQAVMWSPDELRGRAAELGRQMADLGVDWDLAPVLDLTDAPADTVIGDRSFGTDPSVVGAYGGAFAAGLRDAGLVTNGKHFPDHGLTTVDTHRAVASVEVSREALQQRHLTPYRLADEHLDSVMLSHLRVSSLDPSLPASLSSVAVDFLRDELDWDRALVTDDLSMQAVASVADQPTAALMALQAGVDVLLLGTPDSAAAAHARILSAVDQGALPVERLRQAVRRALALKGIEGAAASCLLGLPPVAEARAAVDGDGAVVAVVDGVRRPVPDAETLARRGATPVRYSDAELASLPLGDPLVSARRFAVAVVAGEGADPLDVAVQRAEQSAGAQAHARVVAVTTTVPIAAALAADASSGSPVLPVGGRPDRLGGSLDRVVGDGGEVIVVGPVPDGLGRPVVNIDAEDPVAGAMQVWDRRGEPAVETVVVA